MNSPRGRFSRNGKSGRPRWCPLLLLILVLGVAGKLPAQSKCTLTTSVQMAKGNYTSANSTTTYSFYGSLRYTADRWNVSLSLPYLTQNSDLVTRAGGMLLPTGDASHSSAESHRGGHMGNSLTTSHFEHGLGDVYFYGEYRLLDERTPRPEVSITTQVKLPTASVAKNFGTGEYDYGLGLAFRKKMGTFAGFFDFGYTVIGDPAGATYKDPLAFGAGIGKVFDTGRYSLVLYFQSYSRILANLEAPRQASLGVNYKINTGVTLSLLASAGLSETSPAVSLLGGVQWAL